MNNLRRVCLALSIILLTSTLLFLPWSHLLAVTILDPGTVKNWLNESKIYDKAGDIATQSLSDNNEQANRILPFDDPRVKQIFGDALQTDFVKDSTVKVIDGIYAWMNGETSTPEFSINLQPVRQQLADELSNFAAENATTLPICTFEQLATQLTAQSQPWNMTCLPQGMSPEQVRTLTKNEILQNKEIFGDGVLNGNDIRLPKADGVQTGYKLGLYSPILLGILAILSAAGVIFLSAHRQKGIKLLGVIMLVCGILTSLSTFLFSFSLAVLASIPGPGGTFIGAVVPIITAGTVPVLTLWSIVLVVIGATLIVTVWLVGRNKTKPTPPPTEQAL